MATPTDRKAAVADEDFDCDYFRASCAQPLVSVSLEYQLNYHTEAAPESPVDLVDQRHLPHVAALIEKPNWTLAA